MLGRQTLMPKKSSEEEITANSSSVNLGAWSPASAKLLVGVSALQHQGQVRSVEFASHPLRRRHR